MPLRFARRVVIRTGIIFVVFVITLSLVLRFYGQRILLDRLVTALDRKVMVDRISFSFPFAFRLHNINIDDVVSAKEMCFHFGLTSFFGNKLHLSKICLVEPKIVLYRDKEGKIVLADTPEVKQARKKGGAKSIDIAETKDAVIERGKEEGFYFLADTFVIQGGTLIFINRSSIMRKFDFTLDGITLKMHDVAFPPMPIKTTFDLAASIDGLDMLAKPGKITLYGWTNLFQKDMEAELNIKDSNDQSGLTAVVFARNNDARVTGKLQAKRLLFQTEATAEEPFSFRDVVFGALQSADAAQSGMVLDFVFTTKLDNFQVEQISFSGSIQQ